ncbi:MAG: leucine-rich repeat domain-containing protein [Cyanobacteria bacterium J06626_18]
MHEARQSGTVVQDRYRILSVLGRGGSGITYTAADAITGHRVALKELSLKGLSDWKKLALFEREAQVLENLQHPAIPNYLDYFQVDSADNRFFYIAQELVEGKSLASLVTAGKRYAEAEVRRIALEVLQILQYLHELNPPIIHRDIKPQNIIQRDDGQIFLVDFGAVQSVYRHTVAFGSTVVGTYGYMAPEQFQGQAYPATDLYGLGATLLNLLTHRSPSELPKKRLKCDFRPYVTVSAAFADWLDTLLEPLAEERFDSARDAIAALTPHSPARAPYISPTPLPQTHPSKSGAIASAPHPAEFDEVLEMQPRLQQRSPSQQYFATSHSDPALYRPAEFDEALEIEPHRQHHSRLARPQSPAGPNLSLFQAFLQEQQRSAISVFGVVAAIFAAGALGVTLLGVFAGQSSNAPTPPADSAPSTSSIDAETLTTPIDTASLETFSDWCANKERLTSEARNTVDVLLSFAGTQDCYAAADQLAGMDQLYLGGFQNINRAIDLAPLASLTHLKILDLQDAQVKDLDSIENLSNLHHLNLGGTGTTDITPLASLTNLTYLRVENNQITDLTPLAKLTNLKSLFLTYNAITDVSPLAGLTNLQELSLGANPITEISPLASLTNLSYLDLNYAAVADITPLAGLTNLNGLSLHENEITDITSLANLTNLEYLDLNKNQVVDVTPLAGLTKLNTLVLGENQITDVASLTGLTNLRNLYLKDNPVEEEGWCPVQPKSVCGL